MAKVSYGLTWADRLRARAARVSDINGMQKDEAHRHIQTLEAAPLLLEVLEELVRIEGITGCHYCGGDPHWTFCYILKAQAAIKDARG